MKYCRLAAEKWRLQNWVWSHHLSQIVLCQLEVYKDQKKKFFLFFIFNFHLDRTLWSWIPCIAFLISYFFPFDTIYTSGSYPSKDIRITWNSWSTCSFLGAPSDLVFRILKLGSRFMFLNKYVSASDVSGSWTTFWKHCLTHPYQNL